MKVHKVLGLMSGTSLDGLDLAYCHLWKEAGKWKFDIKDCRSTGYSNTMYEQLKDAIGLPAYKLLQLHNTYGTWLGEQARHFIAENSLEVDCIASHGHTTHHKPELAVTFQLGSGQHLANASGYKVIADFRTNDVALGGQGAPLVPIGDKLLFGAYTFCLNMGGISNISFDLSGQRIAYDIGLANMLLNYITRKIDMPYDQGGAMARSGKLLPKMLAELNALDYYQLPYPKSTGYEWFLEEVVPIVDKYVAATEDLLHTGVHHICEQVAKQVALNIPEEENSLLVTGGGALNNFLTETLQNKLGTKVLLKIPTKQLIENKEALVFALMGVLRLEGKVNVLKSVTGASRNSSSGVVFLPA